MSDLDEEEIEIKILALAKESANRKIKEEQKKAEEKINSEIEDVKFILELINKKMLYKHKGSYWNKKGYELITKEIFLQDYFEKEPKNSWQKKMQIKDREFFDSESYKLAIEVNGEKYYHIGYIINDFENELKDKKNRIKNITEKLTEVEKDFDDFTKQELYIKQMIEDYYNTNNSLN